MQAVRYHDYGDHTQLVLEEVPTPDPGPGQVLLKVVATSFNPADAALRAGYLREMLPLELPHTPGVDVSGTIAALGADVTGWDVGAAVAGFLPLNAAGAAAEYVLAPAEVLAAIPDGVDPVDAAALPAVGLTAWQALFEHASLTAGQRVLINGAGGAVGSYAVQYAHQAGAEVTATAAPRSADRVHGHGADHVIDYTATPVHQAAEGTFDVVLNLAPTTPEDTDALAALTADGGVFVTATTAPTSEPGRGVRVVRMAVRSDAAQLADLLAQAAAGTLRIDIANRRPLAELPDIHARADQGTLGGKTVITP
ncbi:Alcohol dehydrogenase GroES domain protein [Catenulispora acidiphila DSM 44928]|uniref:Alcohol dehydrogenase GroES domain protein n=1 Tax=Catenulispora acidiphila (strain DSM 44928 / JCM 14897 / NBRC 102108 / NRRL B-24433 / ID139908) TaxID=479433 RepID=C7PY69_CATAD|nr:NADP-dependent oxidoreductase [Catenulispora acidiphila]ACU75359.1 Alcohol dehydrogenase GroES domain protein [Catenulispora acidiphila DSM 44928]